ncbi:MAG: SAVED domain-containing protein [Erysipelotrichia bacterium]|nr:SAVED domain-containing protein [Erysipelotrichia bacterium]
MFGIPVQKEISDEGNIKDLRLADFKVKESIVDFVDVYNPNMTEEINKLIVEKIKKNCTAFINRSKDYKSCFTGMAPIPYTILAGTYLSAGKTRRYFEYRRSDSKYYELCKNNRKRYDKLEMVFPNTISDDAKEVVVSLSVTRNVKSSDLAQFDGMDIIEIKLPNPKDNIITSVQQLDEYASFVLDNIEGLGNKYPKLEKVHSVASIPSCLSIELGKKFALNSHRLTQIVSYHYVNSQIPKYPFGIVVSDGSTENRGKLIKG